MNCEEKPPRELCQVPRSGCLGQRMDIVETKEGAELLPSSVSTVALAINGASNSKYVVRWALDKFASDGKVLFKLLHVRSKIKTVPTPMGNSIPISEVRDDVAAAYRKEIEWHTEKMLTPYKKMMIEKQVALETIIVESDNIAEAIAKEVAENAINKLVIGSSGKSFLRKFKQSKLSGKIAGCIPSFCTVYVVARGKLSSVRSSISEIEERASISGMDEKDDDSSSDLYSTSNSSISSRSDFKGSVGDINFFSPQKTISSRNRRGSRSVENLQSASMSSVNEEDATASSSSGSEVLFSASTISRQRSTETDKILWNYVTGMTPQECPPSGNEENSDLELRKLRARLKQVKGMHKVVHDETLHVSQRLTDLHLHQVEGIVKLNEVKSRVVEINELAQQEKEARQALAKEVNLIRESARREARTRKDLEELIDQEVVEKQKLEKALACDGKQYVNYTWEEISVATSSFSEDLKIGSGSNGAVYKGFFHQTIAAVKVLHSNEDHRTKQFMRELEVLGTVRHPHLLLLLGACLDKGCLVYEYMENGSLDDRLQCKGSTQPLPWFYRIRIAWEVATALAFLHSSKPEPIIHRDLKPANILLDANFCSKIGDVGLSTLLPSSGFSLSTVYKDTAPVGTFFYMDPEYQRTGMVSPKSDTYALGMVILQLLTAKAPIGLTHIVETALENDCLLEILDTKAGEWPNAEAQEMAILGLSCLELKRKDRPDLKAQVLPNLERLKAVADNFYQSVQSGPVTPPSHFFCPLLKKVMADPCIAADGFTYERSAIEEWFRASEKSPVTNSPFVNKDLMSNHSLLSAIKEWQSRTQQYPSKAES